MNIQKFFAVNIKVLMIELDVSLTLCRIYRSICTLNHIDDVKNFMIVLLIYICSSTRCTVVVINLKNILFLKWANYLNAYIFTVICCYELNGSLVFIRVFCYLLNMQFINAQIMYSCDSFKQCLVFDSTWLFVIQYY